MQKRDNPDQQQDASGLMLSRRRISGQKISGLIIGPTLLLMLTLIPTALTWQQQSLLAVIAMSVTFWVTRPVPIPVTSILALAMAVVLNVASASEIFGAFSSPTLFLLIGSFIITQSMSKYGLGHRIALRVLMLPGIGSSTARIVIAFGAIATLLSGIVDNGAVAAMMLPIALGLVKTFSGDMERSSEKSAFETRLRFSSALLLITAYGATLGALLTPFGDASNLVGWRYLQREFDTEISVLQWMAMCAPIVIVMFVSLCIVVLFFNRPETRYVNDAPGKIRNNLQALGRMTTGEINTAIAFGSAVFLWFLPALIGIAVGKVHPAYFFVSDRLPPSVVAILAATLLFVLPISKKEGFTLRWRDATAMDWGPILLVGAALALGDLMAKTGLAQVLGQLLAAQVSNVGAITVYCVASSLSIAMSELSSNLVSISVLVPIIPTLAEAGGGDPKIATLVATFSAVYGFMLPISTSANAIVYSSGQIPFRRMIKTGSLVDLLGIVIVVTGILVMVDVFQII